MFSAPVRARVERSISQVDAELGLSNFSAVRIGSVGNVESLYPDNQGTNS